jgi:hypothetical protein
MISCLKLLVTKDAYIIALNKEPSEESVLPFDLCLPNQICVEGAEGAAELDGVG